MQDSNSPVMEELIFLHDLITTILFLSGIIFIWFVILSTLFSSLINRFLSEKHICKSFWVIVPVIILIQICIPSLLLFYALDESVNSNLTIKAIGHQWYWRYEYRDFWAIGRGSQVEFDAYIIPTNELERSIFRLLDVDTRMVVPFNIHVRILISSADVLHAWTVPSLGVKADAVPGRLNQVKFIAQRAGLFFGQCSEICGANHRFIPIVLEIVNSKTFLNWIICAQDLFFSLTRIVIL